jgi:chaperone BCS1
MEHLYQQVVQFIQEQVSENELFKGGLILGIGAAMLSYARAWPQTIWGWIVYHTTVELDVPEGSEAFKWMDRWLAQHNYSYNRARRLTAKAVRKDGTSVAHVSPAPGRHYLFDGGRLIIVDRSRQTLETAGHAGKAYTESLSLRVIGRNRKPALSLLDKAFALADKPKQTMTVNYCDDYGQWFELTEKMPRSINSIVLDGTLRDDIVTDAKTFLARQEFYSKLGVPWRRGYLFYGPPGNGKSSTIFGLASELKMEISYLNLKEVTDTTLMKGLADIPSNSILVIEDIDCLFDKDDSRQTKASISFAALINALDGVTSSDGQLIIMTTNHRDKLDAALIRPGRVDKEICFDHATPDQASQLFQLFYPSASALVVAFLKAYEALPRRMSMASLQGLFLTNEDPQDALHSIGNFQ